MSNDRTLRSILTVIALCLVYLCVVLTPGTAVRAEDTPTVHIGGWYDVQGRFHRLSYTSADGSGAAGGLPVTCR